MLKWLERMLGNSEQDAQEIIDEVTAAQDLRHSKTFNELLSGNPKLNSLIKDAAIKMEEK